ncbi:hypothetical protein [Pseudomaricurvus sp. HS19]|uniref:hypothetical protein n=1 Tax=Pseudomaricurvus sp. HS19 TaxID=2692626 RepID=UPI001371A9BA|nr:hypothetical protein [Pseudomaricurvus sp. HS19]MYM63276.1 hypothetical protein [Pseudomaricurvus sp. HS19]
MSTTDPDLLFAKPPAHPHWIDSACFYLTVPELHLHGIIFYFFRPNLNMLTGGPVIWDRSGQTVLDCLHYNFSHNQPLPQPAQKFNFAAANSLCVTTLEPHTRYGLSYNSGGLELALQWQATSPLHAAPQRDANSFHAEQPGRMSGWLSIDGRRIDVDCASLRDLSYGVRDYASIHPGAYCWGSTGSSLFQTLSMGTRREQKILTGFLQQDGETASLTKGVRRIEEYGRYGARRVTIDAIDALGRELHVQGQLDDGLLFSGNTTHTVVWSLTRWDWDGTACWGDNQEFYPVPVFRRMARGEVAPADLASATRGS